MSILHCKLDLTKVIIVPITNNAQWIQNLIAKHGEPSETISLEEMNELINQMLAAAPKCANKADGVEFIDLDGIPLTQD